MRSLHGNGNTGRADKPSSLGYAGNFAGISRTAGGVLRFYANKIYAEL